jgi:hypothetical protein
MTATTVVRTNVPVTVTIIALMKNITEAITAAVMADCSTTESCGSFFSL